MKKISIIIPHKNSSQKLERLLRSIPKTNLFETIVIDDNSNDNELQYIKTLCQTFDIQLYINHKKNGAGGARNLGLQKATGDWVLFADADDFFSPNMEDIVKHYISDNQYDIVFFRTNSYYEDTFQTAYRHLYYNSLISKFSKDHNIDYLKYKFLVPWAKLIRKEIISVNKIYFDEIPAGNDMYFSIVTAEKAKKIAVCDDILYNITVSKGSITTTLNKVTFDSRFKAAIKCNQFLRKIKKSQYQQSLLYFIGKAHQFGLLYNIQLLHTIIRTRSNPFIGFSKIFRAKEVLQDRENPSYTIKKGNT